MNAVRPFRYALFGLGYCWLTGTVGLAAPAAPQGDPPPTSPATAQPAQPAPDVDLLLQPGPPDDEPRAQQRQPERGRRWGDRLRNWRERRGQGDDDDGGFQSTWRRLSDEEKAELFKFIEQNFPQLHEELQRLREDEPWLFHRRMKRLAPELLRIMDIMETDPERARLFIRERAVEMKLQRALELYHRTEAGTQRDTLRGRIRELVAESIDCRQTRHELEIRDMERRVEQLKRRLQRSADQREELIDQALERYLSAPPDERDPDESLLDGPRGPGPEGGPPGRHGRRQGPHPRDRDDTVPPPDRDQP